MIELSQRRQSLLIYLALALATAAVYWTVRRFGFVNYDDDVYISPGTLTCGMDWRSTDLPGRLRLRLTNGCP